MKRNNDRGEGENNIENKTRRQLPQQLILEILLKLPVKSLVRFKCVCKSWLYLISHSNFATSHFDRTIVHTHRLIFSTSDEIRSIDFQASLNDDATIVSLNFPLSFEIGGSCRGFLFWFSSWYFYLWNPSTGIHKQLPCSPIMSNVENMIFTYLYGFGYDPTIDDYLVICGSYDPSAIDVLTHLEFFSLRDNTWKEIEGVHLPYMNASDNHRVGILFNGAIHWLAYRVDTSLNVIIAFDLIEKRISDIFLPDDDFYHDPTYCDLWVFGGFMSVWARVEDAIEIWVMKEYGVCSSWTKTLVLPISENHYFYPICSTNDGDILGSDGSTGLVKYKDNGQLVEHRSYCSYGGFEVALYTESLLPLPPVADLHLKAWGARKKRRHIRMKR